MRPWNFPHRRQAQPRAALNITIDSRLTPRPPAQPDSADMSRHPHREGLVGRIDIPTTIPPPDRAEARLPRVRDGRHDEFSHTSVAAAPRVYLRHCPLATGGCRPAPEATVFACAPSAQKTVVAPLGSGMLWRALGSRSHRIRRSATVSTDASIQDSDLRICHYGRLQANPTKQSGSVTLRPKTVSRETPPSSHTPRAHRRRRRVARSVNLSEPVAATWIQDRLSTCGG